MFKQSKWLKKYGIWIKIFLIGLFTISLGTLNLINSCREINNNTAKYSHNAKLEDWTKPPTCVGVEFEAWKARKESAKKEMDELVIRAEAKGNNYSIVDYFADYNKLMDLEDKYNFLLTGIGFAPNNPLPKLMRLRDSVGMSSKLNENIAPNQQEFIESVQDRISMRRGEVPPSRKSSVLDWQIIIPCLRWLATKYLILMLFWLLIYIIRFEEHMQAKMKVQRFHHEKHFYFESEEIAPGELSFKNEILICPWRFFSRIIFWPFFCWKYPLYETTAEMVRFNRLKAEYLRYKQLGYQLSDEETLILRSKAKAPVNDFAKTIKGIKEFQITPLMVRKSLTIAYLSLFLGVILQPAIVLASTHSEKVNAHFYGQIQIVEAGHETQFFDNGADPPNQNFPTQNWLLKTAEYEFKEIFLVWRLVIDFLFFKLKEIVKEIFHIPLAGCFSARQKFLNR